MKPNDSIAPNQPAECSQKGDQNHILVEPFGTYPDGRAIYRYTLKNANGLQASVMNLGATLLSMSVPDKLGNFADVVHGFDRSEDYLSERNPYFGATVGRFANRIKDGKFSLNGIEYSLALNNEPNGIPCHLHGGLVGFNKVLWSSEIDETHNSVSFFYTSIDGEESYPGTLKVKVTYTLNDEDELIWEVSATTDAPTILNLVHHSYWNLSGNAETSINDHSLMIHADHFLDVDKGLIPTGELSPVAGTPMDFRKPRIIGERLHVNFEPLHLAGGYDHAWVLKGNTTQIHPAAWLKDPKSGRTLEVFTNQAAMHFYGGNFLSDTLIGKNDATYAKQTALCLETENFPDAPNHPSFPSAVLLPDETYRHITLHKFSFE